jgi:hypothetical protein
LSVIKEFLFNPLGVFRETQSAINCGGFFGVTHQIKSFFFGGSFFNVPRENNTAQTAKRPGKTKPSRTSPQRRKQETENAERLPLYRGYSP